MSDLYGYITMDCWERSYSVPPLFSETACSHSSFEVNYTSPNKELEVKDA